MLNRSTLIRSAFATAGLLLAASAVPALATEHAAAGNGTTNQSIVDEAQKKICLSPTVTGEPIVTGSMIAKRDCRTKAQWIAKGVTFRSK